MTTNDQDPAAFYQRHVFFCTNERYEGHPRGCCKAKDSEKFRNYMKARAKELGLDRVRINTSGCLDRCELGPALVIYPEGVWYKCESIDDAERILLEHVQNGNRVSDLMLGPND